MYLKQIPINHYIWIYNTVEINEHFCTIKSSFVSTSDILTSVFRSENRSQWDNVSRYVRYSLKWSPLAFPSSRACWKIRQTSLPASLLKMSWIFSKVRFLVSLKLAKLCKYGTYGKVKRTIKNAAIVQNAKNIQVHRPLVWKGHVIPLCYGKYGKLRTLGCEASSHRMTFGKAYPFARRGAGDLVIRRNIG